MTKRQSASPRRALGCWSGPSLDGSHAALVETDGITIAHFGPTAFRPWDAAERAVLQAALSRWPGEPGVAEAGAVVDAAHAELCAQFDGVDILGLHGPTLAHEKGRGSHQAGGAPLAGVDTIWDFRNSDMGLGGAGTPITPFYFWALARRMGSAPVVFLLLGGVGRLIRVDPGTEAPEAPGAVMAFDTGPLCGLLDDAARARTGQPFDDGGRLAARGSVHQEVVRQMLALPHFRRMPPKTLRPEEFGALGPALCDRTTEDALATLTACGVAAILSGLQHLPATPTRLVVTGGGLKNLHLMNYLQRVLKARSGQIERLDLSCGTLQAQAFAWLAVRVLRGLPTSGPDTTGVAAAVGGGQIYRAAVPLR